MSDLRVAPELTTCSDTSNCCEDCPDANVNPPSASECPYFEVYGNVPVCTREGNSDNQIRNEFFGLQDKSIGFIACATETNLGGEGVI